MDPLSDVLASLKPRSLVARGIGFSGALSLRWPRHPGIKCYALLQGTCFLTVEGSPTVQLNAGDCFLLPRGLPFCLTTDPALPSVDFETMRDRFFSHFPRHLDPDTRFMAGGHFILQGDHADMLLSLLPPIVHLRSEDDRAAMRWALERLQNELAAPQPGGHLMAQQIAYMMLIQAIRLHLLDAARGNTGWLFALADRQMGAAIACMHDRPDHPWTLASLAAHVGMSRSVFAQRFRATVGLSPMDYLTRWRMLLAAERLRTSADPVASVAASLGYQSESAFGKAFRKVMGSSPKRYSRQVPATQIFGQPLQPGTS